MFEFHIFFNVFSLRAGRSPRHGTVPTAQAAEQQRDPGAHPSRRCQAEQLNPKSCRCTKKKKKKKEAKQLVWCYRALPFGISAKIIIKNPKVGSTSVGFRVARRKAQQAERTAGYAELPPAARRRVSCPSITQSGDHCLRPLRWHLPLPSPVPAALAVSLRRRRLCGQSQQAKEALSARAIWFSGLALTMFVLEPARWSDPFRMLAALQAGLSIVRGGRRGL